MNRGFMRDLMHNTAFCAQFMAQGYEGKKDPVSDRERKLGYAAMIVLSLGIAGVIALFIVL